MTVMTKQETKLISDSWDLVAQDLKGHGLKFFKHLFATNPDVQAKYFGHMKKDADLEKHGVRVFNAIGAMVTACENEDDGKLVKKIHEITRNHHPRGIARPHYELVLKVVLEYLGNALGDNLSKDGGAAWTKLFAAYLDVAEAELKAIEDGGG